MAVCYDVVFHDVGKGFNVKALHVDFAGATEGVDDTFTSAYGLYETIFQVNIVVQATTCALSIVIS